VALVLAGQVEACHLVPELQHQEVQDRFRLALDLQLVEVEDQLVLPLEQEILELEDRLQLQQEHRQRHQVAGAIQ
jgi:hypothetical protein